VVEDFARLLSTYQVTTVVGDRYAGEWPREAFRRHGIAYGVTQTPLVQMSEQQSTSTLHGAPFGRPGSPALGVPTGQSCTD
jgi:hypothetical protein